MTGLTGFTMDAGGLIALERRDRHTTSVVRRAIALGSPITVPATVLAQVMRNPATQAVLSRLINQEETSVPELDLDGAYQIGYLLAKSGTTDIFDAHVALCAMRTGQPVITSDPADLKRIVPNLQVVVV